MKQLLYKEFKLAWHPLCYVFPIVFSLFILIPSYPAFIGMMLVGITYTILFLGPNKGKQTNDLYYTVNLPVRKQDIVISRFISMLIMQVASLLITGALAPLANLITNSMNPKPTMLGFGYNYIGVTLAFGILGFIIVDAFYLLMFYKNGRSIIAPSLISMVIFAALMTVFTIVLPMVVPAYNNFFCNEIWIQFICLAIAIAIYAISHIFILKGAIRRLNKLNF